MLATAKRFLIGAPIATSEEHHHRLRKIIALPVFASDAISSTAYATDEILVVFLLQAKVGSKAWGPIIPIGVIVCVLLAIVVTSYFQTIHAYPSGGGSYIVSRENLGRIPSLVAGSSLLVDYVLTVAVSVAGGVLAIKTATGFDQRWTVPICLLCIIGMTVANLRGVKESGAIFAGPTYFYVVMLVILIFTGLYRIFVQHVGPIPESMLSPEAIAASKLTGTLTLYMLLRGFSSGAVALSGVEAISNGVPAFQKPEAKNASHTLLVMGMILGSCFLGVCILAAHLHPYRGENDGNGLGLMAQYIYHGKGFMFWATMIGTFAILILAANTAYADFPRLSSIIARDGFLPRQFANRGDRLVFSNGVIFLAVVAGILIVAFNGDISKLIPLYALGVFTGFTLSQAGMVRHHQKLREPHWQRSAVINAVGSVTTGLIAIIVFVLQVQRGGVDPGHLDPDHGGRLQFDRQALRPGAGRGARRQHLPVAASHALLRRAGRVGQQGRARRGAVRPLAVPGTDHRRVGRRRRRGAGRSDPTVERLQPPDRAPHDLVALPRAHPARALLPRRARGGEPRRRDDGGHPRVRHCLEDAVPAQPVGVRPEGAAALPPEHRRHLGAGAGRSS